MPGAHQVPVEHAGNGRCIDKSPSGASVLKASVMLVEHRAPTSAPPTSAPVTAG